MKVLLFLILTLVFLILYANGDVGQGVQLLGLVVLSTLVVCIPTIILIKIFGRKN